MDKFIVIFILLLSIFPSWAKENHPLIEEGKVWEYVKSEWEVNTGEKTYLFSRYGFIGTEEKGGTEYAVWTLIDETKYYLPGYDLSDRSQENDRIWEVETTEINRPVALIRENNGKVYMFPEKRELSKFDPETKRMIPYALADGEDVLLYDFCVEEGQWVDDILYNSFCLTPAYVTEIGETTVGQENMKSYSIITSYENPNQDPTAVKHASIECVESVGVIAEGSLTDIFTTVYIPVPSYNVDSQGFYALYDSDGNILFERKRFNIPDISGVPDIRSHKVGNDVKYNLMGQKIREALPGSVYICNGKKFIGK